MTTEQLSPEDIRRLVRESGILDEMREELMDSMPVNAFQPDQEGMANLEAGMGGGGFPWQYWKRRDGRVITGPEPRETMYQIYMRKGYTPLPGYGKLPTPGSQVPCCPNLKMKENQFHVLLAHGGAKEMAIAQIITAGWDIKPPVVHGKAVEFPQLKGVTIERIECDECDKPIAGVKGTNQVMTALRQHGKAAHGFARRDVDEMLYRIGYLQDEPRKAPVRRRVAEVEEEEEAFVCDQCGASFSARIALTGHKRSHK